MNAQQTKNLRKKYALSRDALAKVLGVSSQTVYFWECGTHKPSRFDIVVLHKLEEISKNKETFEHVKQVLAKVKSMPALPTSEELQREEKSFDDIAQFGLGFLLQSIFSENEMKNSLNNFNVTDTEKDFSSWINQDYISKETKKSLEEADILIVPSDGFRDYEGPCFPVGTESFFVYVKEALPTNVKADICIEDDDYKELALHSDLINIGIFIATSIAAPILVNLISEWLKKKPSQKREVKFELHVLDKKGSGKKARKKSKKISYEGDSEGLQKIVEHLKNE